MLSLGYVIDTIRSAIFSHSEAKGKGDSKESVSIADVLKEYQRDPKDYVKIRDILNDEFDKGLSKSTNAAAAVKMFITYVQALPDGTETGSYLALDLGGTNFRVLLITLQGKMVDMKNKIYPISEELMIGRGTQLFDHIANCISSFIKDNGLTATSLPLGFTFSFPCKQEGLAVGRLVRWTKGFKCEGVENEDVVQLLHDAIRRRGDVEVECLALLNDTVGCLMSCAFQDHNTRVGVILGTGTNACYVERLDRVELWDGETSEPNQVIINTEWGAFGDNGCLEFVRTKVDREIDDNSLNPKKQTFEKMISGMYMGEMVRCIIVQCATATSNKLFQGVLSEELNTPYRFYTKYVSEIEKDEKDNNEFHKTKEILDEIGMPDVSVDDCRIVHDICRAVSERAAFLASAGIAALLNRIDQPDVTVAVDGSLYRFHPKFHDLMMAKTTELLNRGLQVKMMLSEDGSGIGAALVAAVSHHVKQRRSMSLEIGRSMSLEQ